MLPGLRNAGGPCRSMEDIMFAGSSLLDESLAFWRISEPPHGWWRRQQKNRRASFSCHSFSFHLCNASSSFFTFILFRHVIHCIVHFLHWWLLFNYYLYCQFWHALSAEVSQSPTALFITFLPNSTVFLLLSRGHWRIREGNGAKKFDSNVTFELFFRDNSPHDTTDWVGGTFVCATNWARY